ncbi:MAG TPA: hypothetical protein VG735_04030, partial [Caulobacterales bacterium]|nr:hypothetical protein [Caulobacterales bacterium]
GCAMTITPDEAARALDDVDRAWKRGSILRGYRISADYFLMWGVLWIGIYLGPYFFPRQGAVITWVGQALGGVGMIVLSLRGRADGAKGLGIWRPLGVFAAIVVFMTAEIMILHPGAAIGMIPALTIALMYAVMGCLVGARYFFAGAVLMTVSIAAYFLMRETYIVVVGLAGGATMIMTGLWLRQA